jgi:hypothetical protein
VHHWLSVELESDANAYAPVFFWRQQNQPTQVSRMELPGPGAHFIDLAFADDWRGEIIEIGFLFEDPGGRAARLAFASLHSDSLALSVSKVLDDWTEFEPFSLRSVNILDGGSRSQRLALPLVLLIWVLTSLLIYAGMNFRRNVGLFRFAVVIFLISWVILDVRWTRNQVRQSAETLEMYVTNPERAAVTVDGYLPAYISRLKREVLSKNAGKILLIADESVAEFFVLKARYYLLPHAAALWPETGQTLDPEQLDYVLLFQPFYDEQAARNPALIPSYVWQQIPVPVPWRPYFRLVDVGDFGLLFAIEKPAPTH